MTGLAHPSVPTLLAEISVLLLLVQSTGEVRHALRCLSGAQSHSCCQPLLCSGFFCRAEHEVTKDRSATISPQLWIGACVVCGQSEGRAARLRVVGRGGGGGRGSEIRSRNAAATAHRLNCPPRVKLFNFSPFARLNPTLGEQKPKVGNDQEMGAQ